MNDIDTLAEITASNIVNGNIAAARFVLWGNGTVAQDDIAVLTLQVVYALSYEMGGDIPAALERVKNLINV